MVVISENTGPIFTKYSGLIDVWYRGWLTRHCFAIAQGTTNFRGGIVEICLPTFIHRIGIPKWIRVSQRRWAR